VNLVVAVEQGGGRDIVVGELGRELVEVEGLTALSARAKELPDQDATDEDDGGVDEDASAGLAQRGLRASAGFQGIRPYSAY
jgi:hypothetical protein